MDLSHLPTEELLEKRAQFEEWMEKSLELDRAGKERGLTLNLASTDREMIAEIDTELNRRDVHVD